MRRNGKCFFGHFVDATYICCVVGADNVEQLCNGVLSQPSNHLAGSGQYMLQDNVSFENVLAYIVNLALISPCNLDFKFLLMITDLFD